MFKGKLTDSLLLLGLMLWAGAAAYAQGTAFTYQGKLVDGGNPANGQYDLQFKLFDTQTVGTGTQQPPQQPATITLTNITVTAGIFTVQLDFGVCASCFDGSARFLEIAVKQTSGSTFTTLGPRQPITSTPYAIKSQNAATADGLSIACINCVTSSQIQSVNGSAVTGAIPVAGVPAGSGSYIQNTTSQQATSNFNISGSGAAGGTLSGNIVNAATQYNIGINPFRVLSTSGGGFNDRNIFVGANAGQSNPTGLANAFFGRAAGFQNTSGNGNSFFGAESGLALNSGTNNSFFGVDAAAGITTGNNNSAMGANTNVSNNLDHATAIGADAVVTASNTIALGRSSGADTVLVPGALTVNGTLNGNLPGGSGNYIQNTTSPQATSNFNISGTGTADTFDATTKYSIGGQRVLSVGNGNVFVGLGTGNLGFGNSYFGDGAGGSNVFTGSRNSFFGAGAGGSNKNGSNNSFFGEDAGAATTTDNFVSGNSNSFFGIRAGQMNTTGSSNSFFGTLAGQSNTTENGNTFIGASSNGAAGITNSTAIGTSASVTQSNSLVLGSINGVNNATADTNVGIGTTAPLTRLDVADTTGTQLRFGDTTADNGGYLISTTSSQAILSGGAKFNGTNWIAKSNAASLVDNINGSVRFLTDSGLTTGSSFSPTEQMRITSAGNVGIGTTTPAAALEVRGDVKLGASGQFFAPGGAENLRILRGRIAVNGALLEGTGFTPSRIAAGHYRITYTTAFAGTPAVTVTAVGTGAPQIATINGGSTLAVDVFTWSIAGALGDAEFHFIIIGGR